MINNVDSGQGTDTRHPLLQGQVELTVLPQGIEVVVAADSLRIGATAPLTLDASGSKDLDNLPGDLNFRCVCGLVFLFVCFICFVCSD